MKKGFVISFLVACIAFSGIFFGIDKKIHANDIYDNDELEEDLADLEDENEMTVLFMGVDGTDVRQEKGLRSDTMILGRANFESGRVSLLSIPRDTRVAVDGRLDKINHAHSFGGPELALKTVEDFLGVDIDYYVKVDFTGVKEIVDAIGGVEIDVPQRMYYSDPTAKPPLLIDLEPGLQTLDGQKSHDFLRFRRYKEGDVARVRAQQYFLKEMAKQTIKPANIFKIDKLIKTYYDYVDTDMPLSVMLKYGLKTGNLDIDNMETYIIPGEGEYIDKIAYWIYDYEATNEIIEKVFR